MRWSTSAVLQHTHVIPRVRLSPPSPSTAASGPPTASAHPPRPWWVCGTTASGDHEHDSDHHRHPDHHPDGDEPHRAPLTPTRTRVAPPLAFPDLSAADCALPLPDPIALRPPYTHGSPPYTHGCAVADNCECECESESESPPPPPPSDVCDVCDCLVHMRMCQLETLSWEHLARAELRLRSCCCNGALTRGSAPPPQSLTRGNTTPPQSSLTHGTTEPPLTHGNTPPPLTHGNTPPPQSSSPSPCRVPSCAAPSSASSRAVHVGAVASHRESETEERGGGGAEEKWEAEELQLGGGDGKPIGKPIGKPHGGCVRRRAVAVVNLSLNRIRRAEAPTPSPPSAPVPGPPPPPPPSPSPLTPLTQTHAFERLTGMA